MGTTRFRFVLAALLSVAVLSSAAAQTPVRGSLSSTGAVTASTAGMGTASITLAGTFEGTVTFEVVGYPGTAAVEVACATPDGESTGVTSATAAGTWICPVGSMSSIQGRVSSYTSGSVDIGIVPFAGGGGGSSGSVSLGDVDVTAGAQPADDPHFVRCSNGTTASPCLVSATNLDVQIGGSDTVTVTASNLDIQSGGADLATTTQAGAIQTAVETLDNVVGTKAAGTAAANSALVGGVYSSTPPTVTNGQQIALQVDAEGNLKTAITGSIDVGDIAVGAQPADDPHYVTCSDGNLAGPCEVIGTVTANVSASETDDGAIAGSQEVLRSAALLHVWNGSNWVRGTNADATHDSAALTTGPQEMGYASATAPSAVTAGDAVRAWRTLAGAAVTVGLDPCTSGTKLYIPISQTTSTELFTGTASNRTYVCAFAATQSPESTQTWALVSGTGTTCGTSTGAMVGGTSAANGLTLSIALGSGVATVAKSDTDADNVCLLQSGSDRIAGVLAYVVAP